MLRHHATEGLPEDADGSNARQDRPADLGDDSEEVAAIVHVYTAILHRQSFLFVDMSVSGYAALTRPTKLRKNARPVWGAGLIR